MLTAQRLDRRLLSHELVETFSAFVGVPLSAEALQVASDVRQEYLGEAMHSLEADYGGVEGYLQTIGKLSPADRERMRGMLLR